MRSTWKPFRLEISRPRIGVIAPHSILATALIARLGARFELSTFGRRGASVSFDLASFESGISPSVPMDVIVNCGASFGGKEFISWREGIATNVIGAVNVLELALNGGARHIVNISSVSAMPENSDRDLSGYGLSKLQAEAWIGLGARKAGLRTTNLRLGPIYTDDESAARHQPFLYAVVRKAAVGSMFLLAGTNDPLRNYLHVEDAAGAIERVINMELEGSFDILARLSYRTTEIIELAYAAFGAKAHIERDSSRPDLPEVYWPDPEPSFKALGWWPSVELSDGLKRVRSSLYGHTA